MLFACNLSPHKTMQLLPYLPRRLQSSPATNPPPYKKSKSKTTSLLLSPTIFLLPISCSRKGLPQQRSTQVAEHIHDTCKGEARARRKIRSQPYIFPKAPLQKLHSEQRRQRVSGQLRIHQLRAIDCAEQALGRLAIWRLHLCIHPSPASIPIVAAFCSSIAAMLL